MQEKIQINARQGDDIILTMEPVAEGQDLSNLHITVGVWDMRGRQKAVFSTDDGTIKANADGTYWLKMEHKLTKHLIGRVFIEITASTADSVSHADKKLEVLFEPRCNNKII